MLFKNVIIINDYDYSQGGASKVAIDTANALCEAGINTIFFSVVHKNSSILSDLVKNVSMNNTDALSSTNKIAGLLKGLRNYKCKKALNRLLDNYSTKNTIVHVHGWTKACSSVVFKVLKKRNFTTVLTLHEYFSVCPNGALYDYKKGECCGIKCGSIDCLKKNCDSRNLIFKIYRFIREHVYYRDMDFNYINSIYISELQKRIINNNKRIKAYSEIIQNPIENLITEISKEKEYDYIYIGRTTKEKGIELFLELAHDLKDKKFIIVGDFDERIPKNVYVTGWLSEEQVIEYMKTSRCLIFPSLWPETFGLNVIKALACGIPCVVSSNTAAIDFVKIDNGLVFQQGNYKDLKRKALEALQLNPSQQPELVTSTKVYTEKLIDFYNKVMDKKGC